jgi:5,10-methylenetetrahydromethanopterin reductase
LRSFGVSVGASPRESLRQFGELAADIESCGFDAIWVVDFQLGLKDVYAALAIAALNTHRIMLGTGVTNLITRHPTVTANAITAIAELSDGRAVLGLGAGATAVYAANQPRSSIEDMSRGVAMLRGLLSGNATEVSGQKVTLYTAHRHVPIYVSASQPRMLKLAAELADGVILMGAADADFCRWQLEHIYHGLEAAHRDRKDFVVDLIVTMSVDADEQQAVRDVRAWATSQAKGLSRWKIRPPGWDAYTAEFTRASAAYKLEEHLSLHASHNDVVSDEFVRRIAIAGPADRCLVRVKELARLDIDRMSFALLSGGRRRRLEQLDRDILPHLGVARPGRPTARAEP